MFISLSIIGVSDFNEKLFSMNFRFDFVSSCFVHFIHLQIEMKNNNIHSL